MSDPVLGTPHHSNSNYVTTQSPVMLVAYLSVSGSEAASGTHSLVFAALRPSLCASSV